MCAGFAASRAPQTVQQRVPLVRASVTRCSAAWSMAPAGYNLLPLQNKKYVPEGPSNRTAKPKQQTNERRGKPTPNRKRREGGSPSGGCVCIVGVDSPQPSLVTSVSSCEAKPTRTKRKRRQRQKTQRSTTQTQEKAKPTRRGGSQQNQTGQKAARRAEPNKEEKGRGGKKMSLFWKR